MYHILWYVCASSNTARASRASEFFIGFVLVFCLFGNFLLLVEKKICSDS